MLEPQAFGVFLRKEYKFLAFRCGEKDLICGKNSHVKEIF